jgi:hypothetical protein
MIDVSTFQIAHNELDNCLEVTHEHRTAAKELIGQDDYKVFDFVLETMGSADRHDVARAIYNTFSKEQLAAFEKHFAASIEERAIELRDEQEDYLRREAARGEDA